MKKVIGFTIGLILAIHLLSSQIVNKHPLSERITGYKIDAGLNPLTKVVTGRMEAFWVNTSSDLVPDIHMHLYMNAFRSNRSTFFKGSGGSPGNKDSDIGWIDILTFSDNKGNDLTPGMKYISPDDGNPYDKTVLKVMLPKTVRPGDTVHIKIDFETRLPSTIRRTGYSDDFYFVAQWFPKFGVYEPAGMRYSTDGSWNCHQFHANSEFYSYHSVYEVNITLPQNFVVGSGGVLMSETETEDGLKTLNFRAEDIVDFAWTAWPDYAVYSDKWNHVNITLLLPKERIKQVNRQFTAVKNALEYFDKNVGPYPWPHLTFVDPPPKGGGAGGMEYTTLFTSASSFFIPSFFHNPELVTVHEFGHAYFMGILASNEFEEPWLDEGVNSFWQERIMDHYYGSSSGRINHPLLKISDRTFSRLSYVTSPGRQVVSNAEYSWNYPHGTYNMMSYNKSATCLHTLMGIVGEETINDIFREYYRKWAFKHPSGQDFIDIVNEVVLLNHGNKFGQDMNWFFDQTLFGTGICDYRVAGIINRKHQKPEGRTGTEEPLTHNELYDSDSLYTAIAQIERIGEVMLPVDVLIHFDNGDEVTESWDGRDRFKDFTYTGYRKIQWVKIDPQFKIRMDVNYINNSMTISPDHVPLRRLINKFIAFLQLYISIISL
jgi:hypothetical protein